MVSMMVIIVNTATNIPSSSFELHQVTGNIVSESPGWLLSMRLVKFELKGSDMSTSNNLFRQPHH